MNKQIAFSVLFLALPLFAGCTQSGQPAEATASAGKSGIAIIDLDKIAHELGSDKQIATAIKQRESALNSKLTEVAQAYSAALQKQKEELESAETQDGGAVQLASYEKQAVQKLNSVKSQAQQNLALHRSQLINKFREAVRPAARKVARDRGLNVIVTKQDSLVYDFEPECDITDEVVQVLRASIAKKATTDSTAQASAPNQK